MDKLNLAKTLIIAAAMEIYDNHNYREVAEMVDEKIAQDWQEIMDKLAGKE